MDNSKMKHIVVLKNLPSNIIEEAIVFIKPNQKVKKMSMVEEKKVKKIDQEKKQKVLAKQKGEEKEKQTKDYVIKEAEMVIANYISNMERERKRKREK